MGVLDSAGRGMESGMFGLLVAEVGRGGRANVDGRIPGIRSATTFSIDRAFCTDGQRYGSKINHVKTNLDLDPVRWRSICDYVQHQVSNILRRHAA
jgi:hypothetical protein